MNRPPRNMNAALPVMPHPNVASSRPRSHVVASVPWCASAADKPPATTRPRRKGRRHRRPETTSARFRYGVRRTSEHKSSKPLEMPRRCPVVTSKRSVTKPIPAPAKAQCIGGAPVAIRGTAPELYTRRRRVHTDILVEEGCAVSRADRDMSKTPRWWTVAPPTPAEAPAAKRRTAARSRGSGALISAAVVAFVAAAFTLLFRLGRQVGQNEPGVATSGGAALVAATVGGSSDPVAKPEATPVPKDAGADAMGGAAGVRPRPSSEVFRTPGF